MGDKYYDLKWNSHVDLVIAKACKTPVSLETAKRIDVAPANLIKFHCSCIRAVLEYACQLFQFSVLAFEGNFLKKDHLTEGSILVAYIIDHCYRLFSKVLCLTLCPHSLPLRGQHYANQL